MDGDAPVGRIAFYAGVAAPIQISERLEIKKKPRKNWGFFLNLVEAARFELASLTFKSGAATRLAYLLMSRSGSNRHDPEK